jgi:hypothetical protein
MNVKRWSGSLLPVLALLWAVMAGSMAHAFEAGAAKVEITPPIGTPLNGYGDRMGRSSTSVHDPLYARTLYLDDGETRLFLVNTDLCLINPDLRTRVLELAPAEVPKENIILTATHTHNASGAMIRQLPIRFVSGRYMPEVLESTAQGIAQSMREAWEKRRRAAIGYGTGQQTNLSVNRRYSGGPTDTQIGVIAVEDADGNPIAVVTNFTGHPTSVGDEDHYAISADYPGFYYAEMERLTSPDCVALFLNGAEGNQTITNPEQKEGWGRTESVGRLLAVRAKEILDKITCGEAKLQLRYATPDLPLTVAGFQPRTVLLQTLEINDLLMAFFPGEACVELALELRQRALARGYQAQFSVGLSNDYLMYFIPRKFYAHPNYEAASNFFGPRIEDWFYREFGRLMTKGQPDPDPPEIPAAEAQEVDGGLRVTLSGTPYQIGAQRGKVFAQDLNMRYQERIVSAVSSGAFLPAAGAWSYWPAFLDPAPLALPVMAIAARPLLDGVSDAAFEEMEGMADGAGLPFDAVWLLQNAANFSLQEDKAPLFSTPLCTMFAVVGDRAGADDLLVGRNLDWSSEEIPVLIEVQPEGGRRFVQAGFTWNTGVYTGMNDAGLVLCAERVAALGPPALKGPSLELVLREILANMEDFDSAAAKLQSCTHLRGYHVLAAGPQRKNAKSAKPDGKGTKTAGPDPNGPKAAVFEFGRRITLTEPSDGLLMGLDPASPSADAAGAARYNRLATLLQDERIVGRSEIEKALADQESGKSGLERIWNEQTRHSVIFDPLKGLVHVAFPRPGGGPGAYTTVSLKGGPGND